MAKNEWILQFNSLKRRCPADEAGHLARNPSHIDVWSEDTMGAELLVFVVLVAVTAPVPRLFQQATEGIKLRVDLAILDLLIGDLEAPRFDFRIRKIEFKDLAFGFNVDL